jgi:hypothetical protein
MNLPNFREYYICFRNSVSSRGLFRSCSILLEHCFFSRSREFVLYRLMRTDGPLNPAFNYRIAQPADLASLDVFNAIYDRKDFAKIFNDGDFLFLALDGNTPIAFQWLSRQSRTRPPYSYFRLHNNQVWVVDLFTLPTYRRLRVASSLRTYRDRFLTDLGYTEVLVPISEDNFASLNFIERATPGAVHYFTFTRILWFTMFRREHNAKNRLINRLDPHTQIPQRA